MKCTSRQLIDAPILGALIALSGFASAQSPSQSQPPSQARANNVSTKVKVINSTIASREGEAEGSLLLRGARVATKRADTEIGNVTVCGDARLNNASSDVEVRNSTISSTGSTRIGNISVGCQEK